LKCNFFINRNGRDLGKVVSLGVGKKMISKPFFR
jgi:hypothetical protein